MKKYSLILILAISYFSGKAQDMPDKTKEDLKHFLSLVKKPYKYRYPNLDLYSFKREYYNDPEIKKRFLEILSNKWTEEELNVWAEDYIKSGFQEYRKSLAEEIAKKGKMTYEKALDSLIRVYKNIEIQNILKNEKVSPLIIRFAAWIDMEESIPILKEALNDPKHYDLWPIRLALARLKVEPYYTDILKEYSFIPKKYKYDRAAAGDFSRSERVLMYLATQESIYVLSEWLYREERVRPISDDDYEVSIATYAVSTFTRLINNESFKKRFPESLTMMEVKKEDIEFCKKWFKENKGKLEFNRYQWR